MFKSTLLKVRCVSRRFTRVIYEKPKGGGPSLRLQVRGLNLVDKMLDIANPRTSEKLTFAPFCSSIGILKIYSNMTLRDWNTV